MYFPNAGSSVIYRSSLNGRYKVRFVGIFASANNANRILRITSQRLFNDIPGSFLCISEDGTRFKFINNLPEMICDLTGDIDISFTDISTGLPQAMVNTLLLFDVDKLDDIENNI